MIRIPKRLMERITKEEFCVLAYYQTNQRKTLKDMQKLLGIGVDRLIRTLSSLKDKLIIQGKATKPETVQLLPVTLSTFEEEVCYLPTWVLFSIKGRAADKMLLCYYLREKNPYIGTIVDLASGISMKHRNANYSLNCLEQNKIISRKNDGHKVSITLLPQPVKGLFGSFFG